METLLHVEPLTRHLDTPLSIGSSEYILYGNQDTFDGENVGYTSSNLRLGAPLQAPYTDSLQYKVPLVKTVGKIPNYHMRGEVITETIHCVDGQTLVPIRTKLRSGFGEGLCVSHLPSLNLIRKRLSGDHSSKIIDPRSEIVESLLDKKLVQKHGIKPWANDWVQDEMIPRLRGINYTTSALSKDHTERLIDNYLSELGDIPNEITVQNAQQLWQAFVPEATHLPPAYHLAQPITIPMTMIRHSITPNNYDFRSWGEIDLSRFSQIAYNPRGMENYAEWFDDLPLTDFNVDLICGMNGEVSFYHSHVAVNRFDSLKVTNIFSQYNDDYLSEEFDPDFLNLLLEQFILHHPNLDDHTVNWITYDHVKIKFMKTMREEAAILLYRPDGSSDDYPVAGMKFDLGLQFLAPMSVIQEVI